jgi:glutamine amidotransferase
MLNNEVKGIRDNQPNQRYRRSMKQKIAILSYGAGNVASVKNALERLGVNAFISENPRELMQADRLIFPGVGHATHAMQRIKKKGLGKVLQTFERPLLGICLGMQLMGNSSEEGATHGLGLIDFNVKKFNINEKVPHMGWNSIQLTDSILFKNIPSNSFFYFVHSYYAEICRNSIATCDYEIPFTAAVSKENYFGVQFHPEKSGDAGMQVLKNFIDL